MSSRALFDPFWYQFGADNVGVLLAGFDQWLRQRIRTAGVDHVWFLARDGWAPMRAYECVGALEGLPHEFVFATRRLCFVAGLTRLDRPALDFLSSGRKITVASALRRVGIDPNDVRDDVRGAGFATARDWVEADEERERLRRLMLRLEQPILEAARRERELLLVYLSQHGFRDGASIALVDVGWNGTVQAGLAAVAREAGLRVQLHGLYLGTARGAQRLADEGLHADGYLFERGEPEARSSVVHRSLELFEFSCVAPHGTARRLVCEGDGRVRPELAAHEAPSWQIAAALAVQEGALDHVRARRGDERHIDADTALAPLRRVLLAPTFREARRIGDLVHCDSFGDHVELRPLARPNYLSFVRNPWSAWEGYWAAYWREGYVARLTLADHRLERLGKHAIKLVYTTRYAWSKLRVLPERIWRTSP